MREAIGGTWLFGIVITFIVMFTSFLAYSISYTKAFNLKNEIINLIERNDGYTGLDEGKPEFKITPDTIYSVSDDYLTNNGSVEALAFLRVKSMGYNYTVFKKAEESSVEVCNTYDNTTGVEGKLKPGGYCIFKICSTEAGKTQVHYKVTTYIALQIPVINFLFKIPISGETKTIYYDGTKDKCDASG